MTLKLMKGSLKYQNQIIEMLKEWKAYNDTHDTYTSPGCIFKNSYDDFEYYINHLEIKEDNPDKDLVKDSVFFLFR